MDWSLQPLYLENQMAVALGGRITEELIFGEEEVTTGASNDLQQVAVARQMVTRFGMSERLWPLWSSTTGNMFLGRDITSVFETEAATIDDEVRQLDVAYRRAKEVLVNNRHILDQLAQMLVDKETVDAEELQELLANNDENGCVSVAYQEKGAGVDSSLPTTFGTNLKKMTGIRRPCSIFPSSKNSKVPGSLQLVTKERCLLDRAGQG